MRRRVALVFAGAALTALALVAPAAARCAGPLEAVAAAPEGGWTLTLKGKTTKVLPIAKVPAKVSWDGTKAGNINPTLRYVYKGQTLYKLIGLVDGGKPTFNKARAKKGYKIEFTCLDGYKPKISSKKIVGKKKWIIAKKKAGALLPEGEAPFRFVGSFIKPFNGKLSAHGIIKIRLIF